MTQTKLINSPLASEVYRTVLDAITATASPCAVKHWEPAIVEPGPWFDWSARPRQPPNTQVEVETSSGIRHTGSSLAGFTLDRYSCLERDIAKARFRFPQGEWKQSNGTYALIAGLDVLLGEEEIRLLGAKLLAATGTFSMVISVELRNEFWVTGWVFSAPDINAAQITRLLGGEGDKTCSQFEVSLANFDTWAAHNLVTATGELANQV